MSVAYSNRNAVSPEVEAELDTARLDLDDLLSTSDIVSINCPYSSATHHLIGPEQFELMRSSAYLVNTARGPIVDETALVHALRTGEIAGAGLDVYEHEPQLTPGLVDLDNVVLIPHLGSATIETRAAMATLAERNTVAVLSGQPALTQ
jgi:glyoxylate reductase